MRKIIAVLCCLVIGTIAQAQTGSTNDSRERCYLDLTKSVKTEVVYKGKRMYQFLTSKYKITEGSKDTTFENVLMWVEEEEGKTIISAQRSVWVEGYWVKYGRPRPLRDMFSHRRWFAVTSHSGEDVTNQVVICKIYNYGQIGPMPNNFGGTANVQQNNNGNKPLIQLPK